MHLDLFTILVLCAISAFVTGLGLLTATKVYLGKIKGLSYWAFATLISAFGWGMICMRGLIPDVLSIIIASALITFSIAVYLDVILKFKHKTAAWYWIYLPVLLDILLLIYFTYFKQNLPVRAVVNSICIGTLMLSACIVLLSGKNIPSSHYFTASLFGIETMVLFLRAVAILSHPINPAQTLLETGRLEDYSYLTFFIASFMFTFGFLLMCNDRYIDDNKRTTEMLQRSEERYRNIVETAQEGIWLVDNRYVTVFVNRKMAEMLEYTPEEMLGRHINEFLDVEHQKIAREMIRKNQQGEEAIEEFRFLTRNGKVLWASLSSSSFDFENGKYQGGLAMVNDITEKVKTLQDLENSRQQLIEAQKIARIGNYTYNFQTGVWSCSHVVDEISGLYPDEIMDIKNWKALIPEEHAMTYLKDLEDTILHGRQTLGNYRDYRIRKAHSGEERWVSIKGEIEYNENGTPVLLFGTIQDITDRKMEEELKQRNAELQYFSEYLQAAREQERIHISREIHDELGQQLTAVKIEATRFSTAVQKAQPQLGVRASGLIGMINHAISTVKKIATQLRPGLLNELGIEAAIESHTNEFQLMTGIHCTVESNLSQDDFPEEVNTHIFRIYQEALTNIARHARATAVQTKLYQQADMLMLEVADNGVGMPADAPLRPSLGIMGMKERAAAMKGELSFRQLPKQGTLVTLKIPITI